jgi:hypothetical protein
MIARNSRRERELLPIDTIGRHGQPAGTPLDNRVLEIAHRELLRTVQRGSHVAAHRPGEGVAGPHARREAFGAHPADATVDLAK